ncbi:MAG: UPF0182 family protein, partial [Deltaproteobacteria bacterium]|nr:UPF0182 family protein [Deltaproteobacteria bacterium]
YPDWLWFENLGFSSVFRTMIVTRFGFGAVVWLFLILIISINLHVARRLSPVPVPGSPFGEGAGIAAQIGLSIKTLNLLFLALILIASFVMASKGSQKWDLVLRYLYQEPFGGVDPIFGRDIGFYIFVLPFYAFIRNGLMVLFLFAAGLTVIWYLKNGALQITGEITQVEGHPPTLPKISVAPGVGKHLAFLAGIMVLLLAWGYQLKIYSLMYSTQGPAFGASFTDVHVKVWAYKALILISIAFAALLFFNAFKPGMKRLLIGGGIWVGSVLILTVILPMMIQKVVVKPNEFTKESQYISHNIASTREAYNLNKIREVNFEVNDNLSLEEVKQQRVTMQNIRIWDERPLLKTYRQIQAIRLYYDFNNVDVDRYMIEGQYRQLMLAARELVVKKLPPQANTWVNRHLTYTHGYGVAASPVNEVTREGLPRLFIKDLPPVSEAGLETIDRPEIYYGEMTDQYVLVKTTSKEFDFPKGDKNVYSVYQGRGGVPINSFIRRLLYAISFQDTQIFFTNYLTPESRIMYNRRIKGRVKAIAPFLSYDSDPYMVVSEGKLYWILDAYTTSDMYPYSTRSHSPFDRGILNYIRNAVKVIIDAYNGDVNFYRIDEQDPIARAYHRIFPDLFKPFSEMSEDLKRHIRYPKDFFNIQAATYNQYHMEDVQVFYNQEDLWQLPDEMYGDSRQKMEPYYIIIKLPEGEKEEFLLMLPFTPSKKDNMIGWLAARSDLPEYGSLIVYKLPKEKLVYGPMQIEARIDQQTDIARELSLWDQKGSRVIRGNLLAIPVLDAFVYVEPIYLEAKQEDVPVPSSRERSSGLQKVRSKLGPTSSGGDPSRVASLPELKRVIVAIGNRVAMEQTLDLALSSVLGRGTRQGKTDVPTATKFLETSDLGVLALEYYRQAKASLHQGDWAGYGEKLEKLEEVLEKIAGKSDEKQ